jgi:nitroimidazol reductase NimA-like FMN-containing flavoprotein (pyridoxamine 5'-phosphate oxidase superfamily)
MALSREEREQFLAEPHVAALSVSAGKDRGPLTVPIWYQYTPGGQPWFITGTGSRKHRLIEAAGYLSLMVDRVEPTVRYVAVDGAVDRIEDGTDEQLVEMTKRYLPPEAVEPYLEMARREHGPSVAVYLRPQHWLSADLGGF